MGGNVNITPVEKVSLRERVAHALRAAVISGELEPGVVYSAPSLGAQFGVSPTPVREAMLDLVSENLVTIVPNKGFRVTEVSESDLDEITELRLLVEPPVVREVTPLIPEADFPRLGELAWAIVAGARAGDLVAYTEADRRFHLALLDYADNSRITALVSDLRAHTRLYGLPALLESGELIDAAEEHLTILETIRSRDQAAVEDLLRVHIGKTRGSWARPVP